MNSDCVLQALARRMPTNRSGLQYGVISKEEADKIVKWRNIINIAFLI